MRDGSPRILVVRLSAIGDVVRVLPAVQGLRKAFPEARIDWAVETKAAGILDGHPALDHVLVFERPAKFLDAAKGFWRFCRRIRKNRYDIVIDFHGILKSGLMAGLSRARDRYGFARPRSQEGSYLFTTRKVKLPSQNLNRVEENFLLCEPLAGQRRTLEAGIEVSPEICDEVDEFIDETFDGSKWIVAMHVPVEREEKRWPAEHFARLIDLLLADGRFDVMLTWGLGQFAAVEAVLEESRRHPEVAPETTDLKHYAWLVHRAHLYFGCDTGPMHIASAMGTPVVAVFGGTDPAKHAPVHEPYETLFVPPPAPGDAKALVRTAHDRLLQITPDMAYDACVRVASLGAKGKGDEA